MDLQCVLHVVLYAEIFEIHEHLSHVYISGINALLFLVLRRCVVVLMEDCPDLTKHRLAGSERWMDTLDIV